MMGPQKVFNINNNVKSQRTLGPKSVFRTRFSTYLEKVFHFLSAPPCIYTAGLQAGLCERTCFITPRNTRSSAIADGPRDASCQLKYCQLPRNSAETTYTTSPDQVDGMKLEI